MFPRFRLILLSHPNLKKTVKWTYARSSLVQLSCGFLWWVCMTAVLGYQHFSLDIIFNLSALDLKKIRGVTGYLGACREVFIVLFSLIC